MTDRTPITMLDPEALTAGNYLLSVTGTGAAKKFTVVADTGTPSGPAGGSLAGTYPNPSLAAGAVNSAEINAAIKDAAAATASLRTLGTGATQAAAGNDARLSDARTPLAHTHAAADVTYAGSTNLAATNVEAALDELDAEKAAVGHTHDDRYFTEAEADAQYAPKATADTVPLGSSNMSPHLGSPALGLSNRTSVYLMDAAVTEGMAGVTTLPAHWLTMHIDLWWTNMGAGSGDVAFRFDVGPVVDGSATPDPSSGTVVAVTAPAQNVAKKSRLVTSASVTPGFNVFEVIRLGANAGDTLANDCGVIGVVLTRAT